MALGPAWLDLDLVCDRGDGGPIHPDSFTHAFKKLAAKVGIPAGARLHDTRHGVATALLSGGYTETITSATGHARPALAMNTYEHVLDAWEPGGDRTAPADYRQRRCGVRQAEQLTPCRQLRANGRRRIIASDAAESARRSS